MSFNPSTPDRAKSKIEKYKQLLSEVLPNSFPMNGHT